MNRARQVCGQAGGYSGREAETIKRLEVRAQKSKASMFGVACCSTFENDQRTSPCGATAAGTTKLQKNQKKGAIYSIIVVVPP